MDFQWYFDGIFQVFSAAMPVTKVMGAEFNQYFGGFFMYFLILLYPRREWKKPCSDGT